MASIDDVTLLSADDLGNDVLRVMGTVDGLNDDTGAPVVVQASGWLSALTNHYDADDYREDGNRKAGAKPRAMTTDERRAYCKQLVLTASGLPPDGTALGIVE